MVIIKVLGGLGNQMYQYAFYRKLISNGVDAKLDISGFKTYELHNGFELDRIFSLPDIYYASDKEINAYSDASDSIYNKVRRKLCGFKKTYIKESFFSEKLLSKGDVYLDGYWQSESFFLDASDLIRADFEFSANLTGKNLEISGEIKKTNSVSIHIRRGDYISNKKAFEEYGMVCDLSYYRKAIEYMESVLNSPHFYIFSNDIDWVKENFQFRSPVEFVSWNLSKSSFIDMQLMSLCKHNIIANSSFSWWGAWLNRNDAKIVLAPSSWKTSKDSNKKRIPEGWKTIKVL